MAFPQINAIFSVRSRNEIFCILTIQNDRNTIKIQVSKTVSQTVIVYCIRIDSERLNEYNQAQQTDITSDIHDQT